MEKKNHYSIYIVSPEGYSHCHAFDEFALTLYHGFQNLGYGVSIDRKFNNIVGIPIILGANLLPYVENVQLPKDSIIFNLEQVEEGSSWFTPQYIDLLKSYQVWDYSDRNIDNLKGFFGIKDNIVQYNLS